LVIVLLAYGRKILVPEGSKSVANEDRVFVCEKRMSGEGG
jgi:hypothetical protein